MTKSCATTVMERCELLASYSEDPGILTRRYATEAMRRANDAVAGWMRDAGMAVRQDNVGNLIGRYEGAVGATKTFILGSHLDTVRDAGKYDGPLGILVALACVRRLRDGGRRLPFALEVMAFADEEGLRYHCSYLGSTGVAGTFDRATLDLRDADGVTLRQALRDFGGDPDRLHDDARRRAELLGYVEVHIEQGPVLEQLDLPVGVVSLIMGQSRLSVTFNGQAGHAGTVPMAARRDALCAAAELVLAVEARARDEAGLVATVGQLGVEPGASNVIPGRVTLSLDVRHLDDASRLQACRSIEQHAHGIGARRHVAVDWQVMQEGATIRCHSTLSGMLSETIAEMGYQAQYVPSGAGHDAVAMADLTAVAMLFVRCKGGVSHSPAESVEEADVAVAIDVLDDFLARLARAYQNGTIETS